MTDAEKRVIVAKRRSEIRMAYRIQTGSLGYRWWRDRYPTGIGRQLELWFDQFLRCALTGATVEIEDPLWLADDSRWERLWAPLRDYPASVLVPGPLGTGGFDPMQVVSPFASTSSDSIHYQFHELLYSEATGHYTPVMVSAYVLPKFSLTSLEAVADYMGFKSWIPGFHSFENQPILSLEDVDLEVRQGETLTHTIAPEGGRLPFRFAVQNVLPAELTFNADRGTIVVRPTPGITSTYSAEVLVVDAYQQRAEATVTVLVS